MNDLPKTESKKLDTEITDLKMAFLDDFVSNDDEKDETKVNVSDNYIDSYKKNLRA